jgi:hypothetical protein
MLNQHEMDFMEEIKRRLTKVRSHLASKEFPSLEDIDAWYAYLAELKAIQGNFNNDVSFLATLMAKEYLVTKYGLRGFDAAEKAQGAPGIDIDARLPDGRRLVAEIKSTFPYKQDDLGAKQIEEFKKDFFKLANAKADLKLFLVTETRTFDLMKKPKYKEQLPGVHVVLLPTGEEFEA